MRGLATWVVRLPLWCVTIAHRAVPNDTQESTARFPVHREPAQSPGASSCRAISYVFILLFSVSLRFKEKTFKNNILIVHGKDSNQVILCLYSTGCRYR